MNTPDLYMLAITAADISPPDVMAGIVKGSLATYHHLLFRYLSLSLMYTGSLRRIIQSPIFLKKRQAFFNSSI